MEALCYVVYFETINKLIQVKYRLLNWTPSDFYLHSDNYDLWNDTLWDQKIEGTHYPIEICLILYVLYLSIMKKLFKYS